jgi:type 2 lantibiotic biosynthesis protein LanM
VVKEEIIGQAGWYQGLTLEERRGTLAADYGRAGLPMDEKAAERRWQQWTGQLPFSQNGGHLERRLAQDGLTEEEFRRLLGETPEVIQARMAEPPAWLVQLAEAYEDYSERPVELPEGIERAVQTTFLAAAGPLVQQAYRRIQAGVQGMTAEERPFDPATVGGMLLGDLPGQLLTMMNRTMVLELHVARMQGLLAGETPDERFGSFAQWMGRPENSLKLWQEYPVLARLLITFINNWLTAKLEFVERLCADYSALQMTFSPTQGLGGLVKVEGNLGDAHDSGRTVMAATFDSGVRLIYKPRSLAGSRHFQALLQWINDRGDHLPFRLLQVLDREKYGWVEFVQVDTCETVAQVERFYRRLGQYLALLYALRATDFHYQNVMAAGEDPVLIDLETFFQPPAGENKGYRPESAAYHALVDSVVRIGLLPQRITQWLDAEPTPIDFSGVGASAGQVYNKLVPQWDGSGTDEMRMVHGVAQFEGAQNQPTLKGQPVRPLDYSEAMIAGFAEMYEVLLREREGLMAADGPLAAFADDDMRIVLRATMIYSMLLKDGRHPDLMRNGLDRERHWDKLWVGIDYQPELEPVIRHERHDLRQDDIPLFWIRPTSRDLWTAAGERIPDFFEEPGMTLTWQRLEKMSAADLEQQLWFVRGALSTLMMRDDEGKVTMDYRAAPEQLVSCESLVAAAEGMGDRLEELAFWYGEEVGWLGLSVTAEHWSLSPLGSDLYAGVPGVTLFLAYLGAVTGRDKYTRLAEAGLYTSRQEIESAKMWWKLVGGFSGWGGAIYLYTHLGMLWQRPDLLDEAEGLAAGLGALIEQDVYYDVMAGSAGCLVALLGLYKVRPNPKTLALAVRCGERLLAQARPMGEGIGWIGPMNKEQGLAGFSHGTAGIAWALLQLDKAEEEAGIRGLGDEEGWKVESGRWQVRGNSGELGGTQGNSRRGRFGEAALGALAYERGLFAGEAGNWPDLRPLPPGVSPFRVAWCHGAAGIGLARAAGLPYLDNETVRQEIKVAAQTTYREGFGRNHSLCHGDLGNLETLLSAGEEWAEARNRLSGAILEGIRQRGPLCGVPFGLETPGLMNGLAGIGYGLLRLAAPDQVPSVLLLQPPQMNE